MHDKRRKEIKGYKNGRIEMRKLRRRWIKDGEEMWLGRTNKNEETGICQKGGTERSV
jgi:hypothetical protein